MLRPMFILMILLSGTAAVAAQGQPPPGDPATWTGTQIYKAFCSTCHGMDGRGATDATVSTPMPDFTDCKFTSGEPHSDWRRVVAEGGPALGLSVDMASWGDSFSPQQIADTVVYTKGFCVSSHAWPPGELNFRRPDTMPKAFPENEVVLRTEIHRARGGGTETVQEIRVEDRFGARGQWELVVPFVARSAGSGGGVSLGNVELEGKAAVAWDLQRQWIVSAGFGVGMPTARKSRGFTEGAWVFQPQLLAGKQFGNRLVLQGRAGVALPHDSALEGRIGKFDVAATWLTDAEAAKTSWLPTLEVLARRDFTGRSTSVYLLPQIYKGISRRGHVAVSFNVLFPVHRGPGDDLRFRIGGFVLWDFGDGVFWEGW